MKTFEQITQVQREYRNGITTLLTLGGIPEHIPATERDWVLFNTNQRLRDIGVQPPLPWSEDAAPLSERDIVDVLLTARDEARR